MRWGSEAERVLGKIMWWEKKGERGRVKKKDRKNERREQPVNSRQ